MYRRRLLITTTGALSFFGGCSNNTGDSSPTATPSPTPTPTQTATPEDTTPDILFANLVSEYNEYGDARENSINSATVGEEIYIAFRFHSWSHDGRSEVTMQVTIYGPSGGEVDSANWSDEQLTGRDGRETWENYAWFDTTGWNSGDFQAEVIVRDDVTDEISDPEVTRFRLEE